MYAVKCVSIYLKIVKISWVYIYYKRYRINKKKKKTSKKEILKKKRQTRNSSPTVTFI